MRIDVSAFLGAYPWRRVPGTSPDALLAAMARTGIDAAWVSHLPSFFWRDPMEGNAWLYDVAATNGALDPVPSSTMTHRMLVTGIIEAMTTAASARPSGP